MTENYAGDYPFWLAPEQVRLLPVTDEVQPYAEQVLDQLTQQAFAPRSTAAATGSAS